MASAITPRPMRGANTIIRYDGSEIHLDDIVTAAEAEIILAEVASAIVEIEAQITVVATTGRPPDPDWQRRVNVALGRKRYQRPRLQRRLDELRKAEREANLPDGARSRKEAMRMAFIRAAYDAFQVAPGGDESAESIEACCAMGDALDALMLTACAFPILAGPVPAGGDALLAHLRWWLAEEAGQADSYQPQYGVLRGRAADLAAVLEPPAPDDADPIALAIVAADMAALTHTVTLVHRDEGDDESEALVDAAVTARDEAFRAVQQTMPGTLPGLLALLRFYGRDCKIYDGCGSGAGYFEHVAAALALIIARENQAPLPLTDAPIRETKGIPGQAEVAAAWRALPPETRDRVGIIATDLVFQAFVHGDDCVAVGQPKDRPVRGRSKAHRAIRDAAEDASNARLVELHKVIESLHPDLFGPKGENPEWAVAMGARR